MKHSQKGQSLVELVICLPLFMLFLAAVIQIGSILLIQADLASLCREAGLFRSRSVVVTDATTLMIVRHLASQNERIKPFQLKLKTKPIGATFGNWTRSLTGSEDAGALVDRFTGTMLGEKIILSYTIKKRGLAGWLFPQGLTLTEELAIKSNHFKHPVESAFTSFLKD